VLRLVRHVRAEVAANDAVPGRVVLFVELLLDESGDVLLDVVLLESLGSAVDGVLLHVLGHVGILDHGLAVSHGGSTGLVELSLLWLGFKGFMLTSTSTSRSGSVSCSVKPRFLFIWNN